MKLQDIFISVIFILIMATCTISCSSDDIFEEDYVCTIPKNNLRSVDIFTDSTTCALMRDSIPNDSISISRGGSKLVTVAINTSGPYDDRTYICTLTHAGITLTYRSIPEGFYPPSTQYDENGRDNVWINFSHSGLGSFSLISTEYRYNGMNGNAASVDAIVSYVIDYGIGHRTYREGLNINIDGSYTAVVRTGN
ncbi:MAG: hypothetical protein NC349_02560 [Paenibacillus sp.]|nr:hypothetical protein [Paenibacillus sp.]